MHFTKQPSKQVCGANDAVASPPLLCWHLPPVCHLSRWTPAKAAQMVVHEALGLPWQLSITITQNHNRGFVQFSKRATVALTPPESISEAEVCVA